MATHELKTWPEPFQAVLDGRKRYEIRKDDRGFAVGDEMLLREWEPNRKTIDRERFNTTNTSSLSTDTTGSRFYVVEPHYTGREIRARVTYMSGGGTWGLPRDLCVMSIEVLP